MGGAGPGPIGTVGTGGRPDEPRVRDASRAMSISGGSFVFQVHVTRTREEDHGVPRTDLRATSARGSAFSDEERDAAYEKYGEFSRAARDAGVLVGGEELGLDVSRDDRPRPRRPAARDGRPVRRGEGGARRLLHSRLPLVRRALSTGRPDPRPSDGASRCDPSTSTRRPDMRYALLVYSDQSYWEGIDEEEAARRRAESMPRWLTLFEEMGQGRSRASRARSLSRRPRRRSCASSTASASSPTARSPRRRSRSAASSSPTLPDLDEAIRIAALVPAAEYGSMEVGLSWSGDTLARGDVQGGVAPCGRDPHTRPRRPLARRGRRAGRVRHGARALAPRRVAALTRRVDHHDRAERRDRPDPP